MYLLISMQDEFCVLEAMVLQSNSLGLEGSVSSSVFFSFPTLSCCYVKGHDLSTRYPQKPSESRPTNGHK